MNARDAYRFDTRSREQFETEIKEGNKQEGILFRRWLKTFPEAPSFTETGCDNDGGFLEAHEVSLAPDFTVEGIGPVEVKFCRPMAPFFHFKLDQTEHYASEGAHVLMVLGSGTENPKFSLVTPDDLGYLLDEAERVFCRQFGGKEALRVDATWLTWKHLP